MIPARNPDMPYLFRFGFIHGVKEAVVETLIFLI